MSPMEMDEFLTRVRALTDEQKIAAIKEFPDNLLWDELYGRFNEQKATLEITKEALGMH